LILVALESPFISASEQSNGSQVGLFAPYSMEDSIKSDFIGIVEVKSWGDSYEVNGLKRTPIEVTVEKVIFSSKVVSDRFSIIQLGEPNQQYNNFKLLNKGKRYLVFSNIKNGYYTLQNPESVYELIEVNGQTRLIFTSLKEALIQSYGHSNFEQMKEFEDNVYTVSKSTGERIKVTATTELNLFIKEIKNKLQQNQR
jgi:hypothetical protein